MKEITVTFNENDKMYGLLKEMNDPKGFLESLYPFIKDNCITDKEEQNSDEYEFTGDYISEETFKRVCGKYDLYKIENMFLSRINCLEKDIYAMYDSLPEPFWFRKDEDGSVAIYKNENKVCDALVFVSQLRWLLEMIEKKTKDVLDLSLKTCYGGMHYDELPEKAKKFYEGSFKKALELYGERNRDKLIIYTDMERIFTGWGWDYDD